MLPPTDFKPGGADQDIGDIGNCYSPPDTNNTKAQGFGKGKGQRKLQKPQGHTIYDKRRKRISCSHKIP